MILFGTNGWALFADRLLNFRRKSFHIICGSKDTFSWQNLDGTWSISVGKCVKMSFATLLEIMTNSRKLHKIASECGRSQNVETSFFIFLLGSL